MRSLRKDRLEESHVPARARDLGRESQKQTGCGVMTGLPESLKVGSSAPEAEESAKMQRNTDVWPELEGMSTPCEVQEA